MCVHIFIQTFASRSRHLQTKVDGSYTFIHTSLYIFMYTYIYTYIYIHTFIQAFAPRRQRLQTKVDVVVPKMSIALMRMCLCIREGEGALACRRRVLKTLCLQAKYVCVCVCVCVRLSLRVRACVLVCVRECVRVVYISTCAYTYAHIYIASE